MPQKCHKNMYSRNICNRERFITDLVYVDCCDPSRVTLQGEEATRVLKTINLINKQSIY